MREQKALLSQKNQQSLNIRKDLFGGMKYFKLITFYLSILFLIPFAIACSPAGPDPWYSTSMEFDESKFPPGLSLVETHPVYEPYALKNSSNIPITLHHLLE